MFVYNKFINTSTLSLLYHHYHPTVSFCQLLLNKDTQCSYTINIQVYTTPQSHLPTTIQRHPIQKIYKYKYSPSSTTTTTPQSHSANYYSTKTPNVSIHLYLYIYLYIQLHSPSSTTTTTPQSHSANCYSTKTPNVSIHLYIYIYIYNYTLPPLPPLPPHSLILPTTTQQRRHSM